MMPGRKWKWQTTGLMVALSMAACSPTGDPSPVSGEPPPETEQSGEVKAEPTLLHTDQPDLEPATGATEQPETLPSSTAEPGETLQEAEADRNIRATPTLPKGLERVPLVDFTPVTGEVPNDLLMEVMNDLIGKEPIDRSAIEVIRAESLVWNDGSLGCPEPGMMYTQALVNGYWIILEAGEDTYDYRASDSGYFFMCQNPATGLGEQPPKQ